MNYTPYFKHKVKEISVIALLAAGGYLLPEGDTAQAALSAADQDRPILLMPARTTVTDQVRPEVLFRAPAGTMIVLKENGIELGRGQGNNSGIVSITFARDLPEGAHNLTAELTYGETAAVVALPPVIVDSDKVFDIRDIAKLMKAPGADTYDYNQDGRKGTKEDFKFLLGNVQPAKVNAPIGDLTVLAAASTPESVSLLFSALQSGNVKLLQSEDQGLTWKEAVLTKPLNEQSQLALVTGLKPSTAYQFKLQVNAGVRQGESNTVSALTQPPATVEASLPPSADHIFIYPALGKVKVDGLSSGDTVKIYDPSGELVASKTVEASSSEVSYVVFEQVPIENKVGKFGFTVTSPGRAESARTVKYFMKSPVIEVTEEGLVVTGAVPDSSIYLYKYASTNLPPVKVQYADQDVVVTADSEGHAFFPAEKLSQGNYTVKAHMVYEGSHVESEFAPQRAWEMPLHSRSFARAEGKHILLPDSNVDVGSYTLEAWIKPDSFGWKEGIISKYQTSREPSFTLRTSDGPPTLDGFNHINFAINDTFQLNSVRTLETGKWYHIAAVYKVGQNEMQNEMRLYINGELDSSLAGVVSSTNASNITIGSDFQERYFDGMIGEVRIWKTARTSEDIVSDMTNHSSRHIDSDLAGYWSFSDETNPGKDTSGNGYHGILTTEHQLSLIEDFGDELYTKGIEGPLGNGFTTLPSYTEEELPEGTILKYKNVTSNEVPRLFVGSKLDDDFIEYKDKIEAANDDRIAFAAVTPTGEIVRYGWRTALVLGSDGVVFYKDPSTILENYQEFIKDSEDTKTYYFKAYAEGRPMDRDFTVRIYKLAYDGEGETEVEVEGAIISAVLSDPDKHLYKFDIDADLLEEGIWQVQILDQDEPLDNELYLFIGLPSV
ncbi:LamG-like jellyroll fold domain-containing protein [Paenibacillus gansuensis]|uniref:LamG-like jellyroll fold domain-containing protein n=1 Tax=Paenibacillus gansuensis TaxID=306542 RepID=A0ABW5PL20_9BACL